MAWRCDAGFTRLTSLCSTVHASGSRGREGPVIIGRRWRTSASGRGSAHGAPRWVGNPPQHPASDYLRRNTPLPRARRAVTASFTSSLEGTCYALTGPQGRNRVRHDTAGAPTTQPFDTPPAHTQRATRPRAQCGADDRLRQCDHGDPFGSADRAETPAPVGDHPREGGGTTRVCRLASLPAVHRSPLGIVDRSDLRAGSRRE